MSITCELRRISADDAQHFLQNPPYDKVLQKLLGCLQAVQQGTTETTLLATIWLATIWPAGVADKAASVAACLALEVPLSKSTLPLQPERLTWLQRLFGPSYQAPHPPDWAACTVADLTDWVVAQNHAILLPAPATLYEVQRATLGITSYCIGVDVPEIQLTDSFTNDLGID